eukprot:14084920-Ditylum_brightwellii.AAC.1
MEIVEASSKRGPDKHPHTQDKNKGAKKNVTTKEDKKEENSKQDNKQSPSNRESNTKQPYLDSILSGNPKTSALQSNPSQETYKSE